MAAVAASSSIDFSKPGKYPVILSDALLGKTTKDSITAIRYNHKPDPTSPSAGTLNLSPSSDDSSSFDLSFKDQSGRYQYAGSRTSGDGQYVLIFDKVMKHFVLHRVDSTFDMNLVSTPWDQDAESLRSEYGHIDPQPKAHPPTKTNAPSQRKVSKPVKPVAAAKPAPAPKPAPKRAAKVEKPKKKPVREPTPEEEDDSDDGLTIEYPDGQAPTKFSYTSTPIFQEAISEPSDEDEDAEGDFEDELVEEGNMDVDHLQLPSPANVPGALSPEEELEMDLILEAELELALGSNNDGESDESEEE